MPTPAEQSAQRSGTGKKKRFVRSDAGARRYKVPIGAEIGSARSADHAAIQKDKGARGNYEALVGDPAKQREALGKMSDADLDKLADIAFSFKSADQRVVALRIAARNEQARRGRKIKPGQTKSGGGSGAPQGYDRSKQTMNYGNAKAMSRKTPSERLVELTRTKKRRNADPRVAQLRAIVANIDKAEERHRVPIALRAIGLARELNATHVLSPQIVELAGRWKHGFIPLDGVALNEKMKGRTGGKKWWAGGSDGVSAKKPSGGVKGNRGDGRQSVPTSYDSGNHSATARRNADYESRRAQTHRDAQKSQDAVDARQKRTNVVKSAGKKPPAEGAKKMPQFTDPRAGLRELSDAELQNKLARAKKRAGTDASFQNEVHKINLEIEARRNASKDTAKAPAPSAHQQATLGSRHKPGALIVAKVPGRLGTVNATVEGYTADGKVKVSYYAGDGKGNMGAKHTAEVAQNMTKPRQSQTAAGAVNQTPAKHPLADLRKRMANYRADSNEPDPFLSANQTPRERQALQAARAQKKRDAAPARQTKGRKDPLVGNMAPKFGPTRPDPEGEKQPKPTTESLRRGAQPLGPKPAGSTPVKERFADMNAANRYARGFVATKGKQAALDRIAALDKRVGLSPSEKRELAALRTFARRG